MVLRLACILAKMPIPGQG